MDKRICHRCRHNKFVSEFEENNKWCKNCLSKANKNYKHKHMTLEEFKLFKDDGNITILNCGSKFNGMYIAFSMNEEVERKIEFCKNHNFFTMYANPNKVEVYPIVLKFLDEYIDDVKNSTKVFCTMKNN